MKYDHQSIEKKWQERWERDEAFRAADDKKRSKYYALVEFPYPSGDGLHVGHLRPYVGMDIIARKRRMEGFDVLYPIGWDAFGLPAENYAIKIGQHPRMAVEKNIVTYRRQIKSAGISFDWSREVNTTDPAYYCWTQWIFLQLFKKGLAYKAHAAINWCPKDKIGLANEEVVGGCCERCGGSVEKRDKEQWMLKITAYADKLLDGLKTVDYIPRARIQQENWIGRSEGAVIDFPLSIRGNKRGLAVSVFTTRPDTLFGATYLVLAPEHPLVAEITTDDKRAAVERYVADAKRRTEIERTSADKEKTGVFTGAYAVNPANNEKIPVWVADYVLASYGTGAIMAVPAHDERDWAFAKRYGLPIRMVVCPHYPEPTCPVLTDAYTGTGHLVDSGRFDGMSSEDAKAAITKAVGGKMTTTYHLHDWVFSRQRYWGEPIPLVHCESSCSPETGGWVAVPEKDLPLLLPDVERYQPTDTGESPLATITSWVNTTCPTCKGPAKRETDVMPNWAGSSWYFLAYPMHASLFSRSNVRGEWSNVLLKYWMPVDWYNGGMEHTTLHLLYSRFWNIFLHDIGVVPVSEPYKRRTSHGLILAEDGEKMSKSRGNVVNPDGIIEKFGADTLRMYEMFIGPFDQAAPWSANGAIGVRRFLDKVWRVGMSVVGQPPSPDLSPPGRGIGSNPSPAAAGEGNKKAFPPSAKQGEDEGGGSRRLIAKTIRRVTDDIEAMRFNTAVAAFMELFNELDENVSRDGFESVVRLLSPFAPHLAEELWQQLGHNTTITREPWPTYDSALVVDEEVTIAVQVDGKLRETLRVAAGTSDEDIKTLALASVKVQKWLGNKPPAKIIVVPNRLVSFVTE